jgi:signal transduction histidine kinase
MLSNFIASQRGEILAQARLRLPTGSAFDAAEVSLTFGPRVFLDQLSEALRKASLHEEIDHAEIRESAGRYGQDGFRRGISAANVVHEYCNLCHVITRLALERDAAIAFNEFEILNLCLEDALAGSVTAHASERERKISDDGTERIGVLAHEMRNVLNTAVIAFGSIRKGTVAPGGSTAAMVDRSHMRMNALIERSMVDVRLDAGMERPEPVPVREILEEVAFGDAMVAHTRGLRLAVTTVDPTIIVHADRQILAATVANLVQNALKFSREGALVKLSASTTASRVLIDVQDECGGLPVEQHAMLLQPFVQRGSDRTGLGLGLSICLKAVRTMAGELQVCDLPGEGCIFTINLPKQPPTAHSLRFHERSAQAGPSGSAGPAGSGLAARQGQTRVATTAGRRLVTARVWPSSEFTNQERREPPLCPQ